MKEKNTKSKSYLVVLYSDLQHVLPSIKAIMQHVQNSCIMIAYTRKNFPHMMEIYEYFHHVGKNISCFDCRKQNKNDK
jgi:hypothetical protein